jgi:hypothetical protein
MCGSYGGPFERTETVGYTLDSSTENKDTSHPSSDRAMKAVAHSFFHGAGEKN